ncbi:hypothetical protein D3C77_562350 [compost metagenome]
MNKVKYYHVTETGLVEGTSLGRLAVVLSADFDRVTAERDALQSLLTAADERADVLERDAARYHWLRDKSESVHSFYLSVPVWFSGVRFRGQDVDSAIDANLYSLKPAEGGGDDS